MLTSPPTVCSWVQMDHIRHINHLRPKIPFKADRVPSDGQLQQDDFSWVKKCPLLELFNKQIPTHVKHLTIKRTNPGGNILANVVSYQFSKLIFNSTDFCLSSGQRNKRFHPYENAKQPSLKKGRALNSEHILYQDHNYRREIQTTRKGIQYQPTAFRQLPTLTQSTERIIRRAVPDQCIRDQIQKIQVPQHPISLNLSVGQGTNNTIRKLIYTFVDHTAKLASKYQHDDNVEIGTIKPITEDIMFDACADASLMMWSSSMTISMDVCTAYTTPDMMSTYTYHKTPFIHDYTSPRLWRHPLS